MAKRGMLKLEHDLGADRGCKRTKFGGAYSRGRDSIGRKAAKSGQF